MTGSCAMNGIIPKSFLMVEDNREFCKLARHILGSSGLPLTFECCHSIADVAHMLRGRQVGSVMVLLDLSLDGDDGVDVLRMIRADTELHNTPVVVLTGSNHHENIQRCYSMGCDGFLTKPLPTDQRGVADLLGSIFRNLYLFWPVYARRAIEGKA